MQITYDFLNELSDKLDKDHNKAAYTALVMSLDTRTELILKNFGYNPSQEQLPLFQQTDEERLAAAKKDNVDMIACPIIGLPYAVTAISDAIGKDVRYDLLAFATDFEYNGILSFRISFHSFGPSMLASSMNQVSGEEEGIAQLEKMAAQGYVFKENEKRSGYILLDTDKNRGLLTAYCNERYNTAWVEIKTLKGQIYEMLVRADPSLYEISMPTPEIEEEKTDILTQDEIVRLKKAVADYKFALSGYREMKEFGSENLVLGVISSYMYEIEQITEVHGTIWAMKEAEYSKSRAINKQIRSIRDENKDSAMKGFQASGRELYRLAEEKLQTLIKPLGLYLSEFKILDNELIQILLIRNCMAGNQDSILLDGQFDKYDRRMFFAFDNQKNIDTINHHLQKIMPSCKIDKFEVDIRNGIRTLWSVTVLCRNASDLKSLIEEKMV